jgi:2,3-bisphosphoglycerate-dependent phosphoglycerate mutase
VERENLFTGWVNMGLTATGEREAARAGQLLASHGQLPDVVHTSMQRRAIRTAELALAACDRYWVPVRRSWRIHGRHYGALQGNDTGTRCGPWSSTWTRSMKKRS